MSQLASLATAVQNACARVARDFGGTMGPTIADTIQSEDLTHLVALHVGAAPKAMPATYIGKDRLQQLLAGTPVTTTLTPWNAMGDDVALYTSQPAVAVPSDAFKLLHIWQSWLGADRASCDEGGKKLWDRIDAVFAAVLPAGQQVAENGQGVAHDAHHVAAPQPPVVADSRFTDDFRGDNSLLLSCIHSLLELDADGALVPHGIGGHARSLLNAAGSRLSVQPAPAVSVPEQGQLGLDVPDDVLKDAARWQIIKQLASEDGGQALSILVMYCGLTECDTAALDAAIDKVIAENAAARAEGGAA